MPLVVLDGAVANHVLVHQILQLQECCRLMPADITQVIGARTAQSHGSRIFVFLYINFVKRAVIVILHPKTYGAQQVVVLNEFNVSYRMDFFPTTDDFIRSVVVNEFQ